MNHKVKLIFIAGAILAISFLYNNSYSNASLTGQLFRFLQPLFLSQQERRLTEKEAQEQIKKLEQEINERQKDKTKISSPQNKEKTSEQGQLDATVYIRMENGGVTSDQSGVVINCTKGVKNFNCYLLSSSHTLDSQAAGGMVKVVFFKSGEKIAEYKISTNNILLRDKTSDLLLIGMNLPQSYTSARIALSGYEGAIGEKVNQVGCPLGSTPPRFFMPPKLGSDGVQILTLDGSKLCCQKEKDFLMCTGSPELGRSGGPLYNKNGEVIGITRGENKGRGVYSSYKQIRQLLKGTKYEFLLNQ